MEMTVLKVLVDTERIPALPPDKAVASLLTDRRHGQRSTTQQCIKCKDWFCLKNLHFKYSCTLVEQPGEPLSIRCELQTRYPAFWCSACTSDCHDPPVDAAAECGAATLPDKRSRDFKQLSPDHVAVVYTMLAKDGKANLQELKETYSVTCPDCKAVKHGLNSPTEVHDYMRQHLEVMQTSGCPLLHECFLQICSSTPEADHSHRMDSSKEKDPIIGYMSRILVVTALHILQIATIGTEYLRSGPPTTATSATSAAAANSSSSSQQLYLATWARNTLTEDVQLLAAANWTRPGLGSLSLPERSLLDLVWTPPYMVTEVWAENPAAYKLAVLLKRRIMEQQQQQNTVSYSLQSAASIKSLLADMLATDAVFQHFPADKQVDEFLAMSSISLTGIITAAASSLLGDEHLRVCTSCGVKGQQHAPDFGTGCVYCIMSECDSCYDAHRKAYAAADAALAAAGPYKHAFVVAGGGLCSLCHAHADTAHLSWYKGTLSVEQLDKVHARVKLTDVQRRYFLNSKRTNVWRLDRLPDDYIQIKAIRSSGEKAMDYYIVPPVACGARDYRTSDLDAAKAAVSAAMQAAAGNSGVDGNSAPAGNDGLDMTLMEPHAAQAEQGSAAAGPSQPQPCNAADLHSLVQQVPLACNAPVAAPVGADGNTAALASMPGAATSAALGGGGNSRKRPGSAGAVCDPGSLHSSKAAKTGTSSGRRSAPAPSTAVANRVIQPADLPGTTAKTAENDDVAADADQVRARTADSRSEHTLIRVSFTVQDAGNSPGAAAAAEVVIAAGDRLQRVAAPPSATAPAPGAASDPASEPLAAADEPQQPQQQGQQNPPTIPVAVAGAVTAQAAGRHSSKMLALCYALSQDASLLGSNALEALLQRGRQLDLVAQTNPLKAVRDSHVLYQLVKALRDAKLPSVRLLLEAWLQQVPEGWLAGSAPQGMCFLDLLLLCWSMGCGQIEGMTAGQLAMAAAAGLCHLTVQVFATACRTVAARVSESPPAAQQISGEQPMTAIIQLSLQLIKGVSLATLVSSEGQDTQGRAAVGLPQMHRMLWCHAMKQCLQLDSFSAIVSRVSSELEYNKQISEWPVDWSSLIMEALEDHGADA